MTGDYYCTVCGGAAIVLWKDGERREVHIVEPRGHAPKLAMYPSAGRVGLRARGVPLVERKDGRAEIDRVTRRRMADE